MLNLLLSLCFCRISEIIPDSDLRNLIASLDGRLEEKEKWEDVIYKKNDNVCYKVWCCRPKVILLDDSIHVILCFIVFLFYAFKKILSVIKIIEELNVLFVSSISC